MNIVGPKTTVILLELWIEQSGEDVIGLEIRFMIELRFVGPSRIMVEPQMIAHIFSSSDVVFVKYFFSKKSLLFENEITYAVQCQKYTLNCTFKKDIS